MYLKIRELGCNLRTTIFTLCIQPKKQKTQTKPATPAVGSENQLTCNDLMLPLFIAEGTEVKDPIDSHARLLPFEFGFTPKGVESHSGFGNQSGTFVC